MHIDSYAYIVLSDGTSDRGKAYVFNKVERTYGNLTRDFGQFCVYLDDGIQFGIDLNSIVQPILTYGAEWCRVSVTNKKTFNLYIWIFY